MLMEKPQKHTKLSIDETTLIGECAVCGPGVQFYKIKPYRDSERNPYYRCKTHDLNKKARRHKETYDPIIEKEKRLKYIFNFSLAEWESLFEYQNRQCAICGSDSPNGRGWHLDHNHNCCSGGSRAGNALEEFYALIAIRLLDY